MEPKFNIDRQRISDEEINKHKDFERLVKQFKETSLQKAKHDKSWWKSKKVRYSAVIAGVTVICTVSYLALFNNQKTKTNETLITSNNTELATRNAEHGTTNKFISPPSSKLNIPYTAYKVNNAKGGELQHPTSSKIKIPKNAFVDKNGKDIVGEVTIEYREFHDHADIIASGIPMGYDSAGTHSQLESAGMFDIKGSQNGEPVFIRDEIKVELASANPQDRFNQYYLDTIERNWKYLRRDDLPKDRADTKHGTGNTKQDPSTSLGMTSGNKKLETLKREIEVIIPKKIDSVKVVYTRKAESLPKAKEPLKPVKASGKQTFNIDADPKDFPELTAFGNFVFELGDENKNYNPQMNEVTWNDVRVSEGPKKGVNYLLTLKKSDLTVKLIVYPVLSGKDFDKAQKNYSERFAKYESLLEKRQGDEQRILQEMKDKQAAYLAEQAKKKAEYEAEKIKLKVAMAKQEAKDFDRNAGDMTTQTKTLRVFNISRFGVFNSDCPASLPTGRSFNPIFLAGSDDKPLRPSMIYLINHSSNLVYSFAPQNFGNLRCDANAIHSFVVFSNNKTYLVKQDEVTQVLSSSSNKFKVIEMPESTDNLSELKKMLEI